MGRRDIILKPYLADNVRFADLVNVSVFQGRQVILPSQLEEQDSVRAVALKGKRDKKVLQRTSDVIKKVALGTQFVLVSLENQNDIHYAMPMRNFISEAADYQKQYDNIRKQHEQNRDLQGNEYLSGFSRKDKIIPVITIVLYFGEEEWDGAKDMYGLMDMQGYPREIRKQLKKFVNNYHINLIDVRHMENPDVFQTDLKQVINFIKRDADKQELQSYLAEHRKEYETLTSETFDVLEQLSNFDFQGIKKEITEKGGNYNMCKAMEEMMADAREEGRQEMCKAMEEMIADAREEGRQEIYREMEEIMTYAKQCGNQNLLNMIAEKMKLVSGMEPFHRPITQ